MLRTPFFAALGLRAFTRGGYERATRRADWPSARMDDDSALLDRHCLVTGANAGIGLEIALGLARHGATVHLVCRRAAAGEAAAERVRAAGGGRAPVHLWSCDLSSLASIRAFAEAFLAAGHPAHVLVNNAGVLLDGAPASVDGHEANFAVNTLGTLAITLALAPALRAAAPARVVFVTSGGALTEALETEALGAAPPAGTAGAALYAKDKRRQIALCEALARREATAGAGSAGGETPPPLSYFCMHPGWADTEGVRTSIPGFYSAMRDRLRSAAQGADTAVWLALEDAARLEPAALYLDRRAQAKHLPLAWTSCPAARADGLLAELERMAAPALPAVARGA